MSIHHERTPTPGDDKATADWFSSLHISIQAERLSRWPKGSGSLSSGEYNLFADVLELEYQAMRLANSFRSRSKQND